MKTLKIMLASVLVLSVLSTSGCMLLDPWWWGGGGPHGGHGGDGGGPHDGGPR
ncbi:hypothetical protein [Acinetobacter rathckeae]|uniref:hypothetical protein n=1 Tax=Acinetobacter rathckeae TaxID=2605272 RepID=UPI0018A25958|nr:hypothetical protein [Acinetobacter rathckeae]MBF7688221.1 hypothetical protein [Acinetobacter rathckeae]